jgi:hypothetical protein
VSDLCLWFVKSDTISASISKVLDIFDIFEEDSTPVDHRVGRSVATQIGA